MKSGYVECLMFFRVLFLKKAFLWSEEKQVAFVDTKVFESEYYNLFSNRIEEEDFPNELKHNKLLNYFKRKVKFLNSKDLFLEFDFSFEDVEPYKDKKFSLFTIQKIQVSQFIQFPDPPFKLLMVSLLKKSLLKNRVIKK